MGIEKIQKESMEYERKFHQILFRVFLCLNYGRMNDTSTQNMAARLWKEKPIT